MKINPNANPKLIIFSGIGILLLAIPAFLFMYVIKAIFPSIGLLLYAIEGIMILAGVSLIIAGGYVYITKKKK